MTQKIIALVDGSIYSNSVCDHAAWVSRRNGAAVEVLHSLGPRDDAGAQDLSGTIRLGARSALMQELADLDAQRAKLMAARGRAILDDAHASLTRSGVADITTRLRHGTIVETVAEMEADASLIVIGKRGEAADLGRGHLGSNLERIVRASHKPVLVAARAFKPIARVLIAFDHGVSANKAVDHVAQNPLYAGLGVQIVTAGAATGQVRAGMADALSRLKAVGIAADTAVLPGPPEIALGTLVQDGGFDLVVMGAYGHSRIRNLVIGSTTSEMIRSCMVPVVLVR